VTMERERESGGNLFCINIPVGRQQPLKLRASRAGIIDDWPILGINTKEGRLNGKWAWSSRSGRAWGKDDGRAHCRGISTARVSKHCKSWKADACKSPEKRSYLAAVISDRGKCWKGVIIESQLPFQE